MLVWGDRAVAVLTHERLHRRFTVLILGITGYKGAGKTTIARLLIKATPGRFVRHPLAGTLKAMLRTMGLTEAQVDGDQKEVPCDLLGSKTPRWAMQSLGTEWGRNQICGDLWLRAWRATMPLSYAVVVVDDVRFPNEVEFLHSLKQASAVGYTEVVLWRVHRQGVGPAPGEELHPSEAHVQDLVVQREIFNDGSIGQLDVQLRARM